MRAVVAELYGGPLDGLLREIPEPVPELRMLTPPSALIEGSDEPIEPGTLIYTLRASVGTRARYDFESQVTT